MYIYIYMGILGIFWEYICIYIERERENSGIGVRVYVGVIYREY